MSKATRKAAQATKLRDELCDMKSRDEMTDFKVIVDSQVFKVHRLVLAASSPYFKAMLSHNMKESLEGEVTMKGVSPRGVKACIQFIYYGEADLQMGDIPEVLYAASFLQLELFLANCNDFLQENVMIDSALLVSELAQEYGFDNLEMKCKEFISRNIENVSLTTQFFELSSIDIAGYVVSLDADKEAVWSAVMKWIRHDEADRMKRLDALLQIFSSVTEGLEQFVTSTWSHEEVKRSIECKMILQDNVLKSNVDEIPSLTAKACCQIKQILRNCEMGDTSVITTVLDQILMRNFEVISKTDELKEFLYGELVPVLQGSHCSTMVKWEAILKWSKHDKSRKKRFPDLLRIIDFSSIPVDFIQETIRNESLVRESSDAMGIVMDAFAAKIQTPSDKITRKTWHNEQRMQNVDAEEHSKNYTPCPEPLSEQGVSCDYSIVEEFDPIRNKSSTISMANTPLMKAKRSESDISWDSDSDDEMCAYQFEKITDALYNDLQQPRTSPCSYEAYTSPQNYVFEPRPGHSFDRRRRFPSPDYYHHQGPRHSYYPRQQRPPRSLRRFRLPQRHSRYPQSSSSKYDSGRHDW